MARLPQAVAVLVLTLLTSACGTAQSGPHADDGGPTYPSLNGPPPPLDSAIVAQADPGSVVSPLASFLWSDAELRTIDRARRIVGDNCMREFGFSPIPDWQAEGAQPWVSWARYGIWNPIARETGYLDPVPEDGNTSPIRYIDSGAISVYLGTVQEFSGEAVPPGGCQGQEFDRLMRPAGAETIDVSYVGALYDEALTRATNDERVASLIDDWRECMAASGWQYSDVRAPFEYWSVPPRRGPDKHRPVVSEEERRSAADDLACKHSTGLLGTWLAADLAYQDVLVEREHARLVEYRLFLDRVVTIAGEIVATG